MHADFGFVLIYAATAAGGMCGFLLALIMLAIVHFAVTPIPAFWWFVWLAIGAAAGAVVPIGSLLILDLIV